MAFKIAHLSDLHIGYRATSREDSNGINLREADGYKLLARLTKSVIKHEVDVVVVSGDVFHSPAPEIRPIIAVQNALRMMAEAGIAVYILAGNHDQNDIRADIASSKIMDDPMRKIYSHVEPYVRHEVAPDVFFHLVSHHMYSEQNDTMSQIKPVDGAVNIFATHGSVIDPILQIKLHTEQSPREIVIPDFLMSDHHWDYSMLGHIHERGFVGSSDGISDTLNNRIYYNGSLFRRGFADKECSLGRGWTLWTLQDDGSFSFTPIALPQRPQFDFDVIDAEKLTSTQVSDLIIENLKSTQVDGTEFNSSIAPMVRQRVVNLSSSKRASMDWAHIDQQSSHALAWNFKHMTPQESNLSLTSMAALLPEGALSSGDVIQVFDNWVSGSSTFAATPEHIKDRVKAQTRKFVEQGQEDLLNE